MKAKSQQRTLDPANPSKAEISIAVLRDLGQDPSLSEVVRQACIGAACRLPDRDRRHDR